MSIHERPPIPEAALINFRRPQYNTPDSTRELSRLYGTVISLECYLREIGRPEELEKVLANVNVLGVAGGDGTLHFALNFALKLGVETFILEGGGTAKTALTEFKKFEKITIPDHLAGILSPEHYVALHYRPPVVRVDDEKRSLFRVAYVLGACHLTVETNRLYDVVRERFNQRGVRASYILAGFGSAVQLYNRGFEPLRPTGLRYEIDGREEVTSEEQIHLGLAVIGVPRLGPDGFKKEIRDDQLRLLTLSGIDYRQLRAKYALALIIGAFSPDRVIEWGLVNAADVNRVSFLPDQTSRHPFNVNEDGELRRVGGRITMTRSPEVLAREQVGEDLQRVVTIIIPKALLTRR